MVDTKMPIVNIAGYRFVDLPDRDELRKPFQVKCKELGLKGTILLSPNGVNFSLAGTQEMIGEYLQFLEEEERFIGIPIHISYTDYQPFRRMLVRLKNEIISLGMDDVRPVKNTGKFIEPMEFKEWLDEGKEVLILDARNDYELRVGTFDNAIDLDIKSFRDFPAAIRSLPKEDKNKPLVMFCTGGIRCEKASVVMENEGWNNVYQIKGGILGYFKETGGAHWSGDCFVFDQRVALDKNLKETDTQMCFACREPSTEKEMQSEQFVIEECCPYCYEKNGPELIAAGN
jgi:predicted sulfurtransferase